jgi:hypothetical protein
MFGPVNCVGNGTLTTQGVNIPDLVNMQFYILICFYYSSVSFLNWEVCFEEPLHCVECLTHSVLCTLVLHALMISLI